MPIYWIWFANLKGMNLQTKQQLLQTYGEPEELWQADSKCFPGEVAQVLEDKDLTQAKQIAARCSRDNIRILTYGDAAYPEKLRYIEDPPLVLYYRGKLPDWNAQPLIGVVGTRNASVYGMTAAKKLGYQIARCGGIVVSGMASGIDGMATRGALTAGTPAIGVLGCGADVVYPPSNRGLFEDMAQYGCLMSEFIPGTPPIGRNFPKRNRIISGLSCGVLVVEAPEKSGALITAQLALDQGRDVFVVPGNIDVDTFVGSNRLLRDGAIAISSGWDIMSEYAQQFPEKVRQFDGPMRQNAQEDLSEISAQTEKMQPKVAQKPKVLGKNKVSKQNEDKKVIDNGAPSPYSDVEDKLPPLLPDEQKIVSALTKEPRPVDDVIAETGLPTARMLATLTLLQVKGIVKQHPGKRISLK